MANPRLDTYSLYDSSSDEEMEVEENDPHPFLYEDFDESSIPPVHGTEILAKEGSNIAVFVPQEKMKLKYPKEDVKPPKTFWFKDDVYENGMPKLVPSKPKDSTKQKEKLLVNKIKALPKVTIAAKKALPVLPPNRKAPTEKSTKVPVPKALPLKSTIVTVTKSPQPLLALVKNKVLPKAKSQPLQHTEVPLTPKYEQSVLPDITKPSVNEKVPIPKKIVRRMPKLAKKPQTEPLEESEVNLYEKYADLYNEVLQEDYGSVLVQKDSKSPDSLPQKKLEVLMKPSNETFQENQSKVASVGSLQNLQNRTVQSHHESDESLSDFPSLTENELIRRQMVKKIHHAQTVLPPWITRQEWNQKKYAREQRLKYRDHARQPCTQLFPGRCFDDEYPVNAKRREINRAVHVPGIKDKRLFQQTENERKQEEDLDRRQLLFKQMWQKIGVLNSGKKSRPIPYRQGSTVILGYPGHGPIVDEDHTLASEEQEPSESEIDLRKIKLEYYKRMAALYVMEESEKKERQRKRMMAATKCILGLCPSLLGDQPPGSSKENSKPAGQGRGQDAVEADDDTNSPDTTDKDPGLQSVPKKGIKKGPFKTFEKITAKQDEKATFFKICSNCRKYIRTSDLSTHQNECCLRKNSSTPTKFDYFFGSATKSYQMNRPQGPGTTKFGNNRSAYKAPQSQQQGHPTRVIYSSPRKTILGSDATHPNPQFRGELLEFHPNGYYFAPADLTKLTHYYKEAKNPIPIKELMTKPAQPPGQK